MSPCKAAFLSGGEGEGISKRHDRIDYVTEAKKEN